ncbi:MAG: L-threonylcarbamoyladenylate synthase [Desulfatiglans sp.]|nr:L-threonylcarbamoyladenylate synthase [Thermodesulfobacteriota bacterium]MEE4352623.1 L-threonylcarbamoyladenylate synthase [Desulfatiglans sp.]
MEEQGGIKRTEVISLNRAGGFEKAVDEAGRVLRSGGLVAYPTESVYGLAVDATNEKGIERVFSLKKRPLTRPILILVSSLDMLGRYVADIPPIAHGLIKEFWPGGLTLVFRADPAVSPLLHAGSGKIAARLSSHPFVRGLVMSLGNPITGTSANISGQSACRNAQEVLSFFEDKVDLIVDGGTCAESRGSTILDVTVDPPKILREGMVDKDRLNLISR